MGYAVKAIEILVENKRRHLEWMIERAAEAVADCEPIRFELVDLESALREAKALPSQYEPSESDPCD